MLGLLVYIITYNVLLFVYPCRFLRVVTTVVIAIYVFIEVVLEHPENLISVLGLIVTILVFFVTSKAPEKVNALVKTNEDYFKLSPKDLINID